MQQEQLVFLLNEIYRETYRKGEVLQDPSYLHLIHLQIPWHEIAQHIDFISDPLERLYLRSLENRYLEDYLINQISQLNLSGQDNFAFEKAVYCIGLLHNPLYQETTFFNRLNELEQILRQRLQSAGIRFGEEKENFWMFIPIFGSHAARLRAQEVIREINAFLFDSLGLVGDENCFYETASHAIQSFLEKENHRGIPISLSALYLILAKRLGFPIFGVNMPRHFLIKWETNQVEIFLDPFNGGRIIPKDAIIYLLKANHYPLQSQFFAPCSSAVIIRRMLTNLVTVFQKINWLQKANLAEKILRHLPE